MKPVTIKGKQSSRDIILHTLKIGPQATVDDLANAAGVSPVTVRHHLNTLQAEGLIEIDSVRRKVGRPYYVYSLSESGHELFPRKYVRLTNRLLEELKDHLPPEALSRLFDGIVQKIIDEHKGEFESLDIEGRLSFLVEILAEEGFLAHWEKRDNGEYALIEHSCPYLSVGQEHNEICGLDKELMISVLQIPVQQQSCMLSGDDCCEFSFRVPDPISNGNGRSAN